MKTRDLKSKSYKPDHPKFNQLFFEPQPTNSPDKQTNRRR